MVIRVVTRGQIRVVTRLVKTGQYCVVISLDKTGQFLGWLLWQVKSAVLGGYQNG